MINNFCGPLMLSLAGERLHLFDRLPSDLLKQVGGYLLFKKNFSSLEQLKNLTSDIQKTRKNQGVCPALFAVDYEGGMVQRFKGQDFTSLPSAFQIGQLFLQDKPTAIALMRDVAIVTAAELGRCGINLIFSPVLDLNLNDTLRSSLRSYSDDPDAIIKLTKPYLESLQYHGMNAVGKHFPGFGASKVDAHIDFPISQLLFHDMEKSHLVPFKSLIESRLLPGVMLMHGAFPNIDPASVPISQFWIRELLFKKYAYNGIVMTDCLNMLAAYSLGNTLHDRVIECLLSGCDFVLLTNTSHALFNTIKKLSLNENYLNLDKQFRDAKVSAFINCQKPIDYYENLIETREYQSAKNNILAIHDHQVIFPVFTINTLSKKPFKKTLKKLVRYILKYQAMRDLLYGAYKKIKVGIHKR